MLKILGGTFKGHTLKVPKGDLIRPTAVLLKRKVFDARQSWQGAVFCDLCAGSGAVGIEAWSRGAEKIFFSESSPFVYKMLEQNISSLLEKERNATGTTQVVLRKQNAQDFLRSFKDTYLGLSIDQQLKTVFFLDPPYQEENIYREVVAFFVEASWFKGELWIESDEKKGLPLNELQLLLPRVDQVYKSGSRFIAFCEGA